MVLVRDLKCNLCGFETAETVRLDVPSPVPAPPPAAAAPSRPARRPRVALAPATVTGLVGKTWARYRIVSQLGRGGMAIVYKAYQPSLDRYVAIKFLLPQVVPNPTMIKRFKQEAKLSASLRHPYIVAVLDFGERQKIAYLVMEYVGGETLQTKLGRPMDLARALRIAAQVASALDYAHSHGVIHRDVKPSNILLARDDWALLSDFGIAKALQSATALTQTGMFIGTPEYMAPEQGQGREVDARCDIYALGVVLFEMLAGRPPFTGDTPISVMLKHCTEPLPSPRELNPDIPEAVEEIVMTATAKEPNGRYSSAGQMAAAIEQVLHPLLMHEGRDGATPFSGSSIEQPTIAERHGRKQ